MNPSRSISSKKILVSSVLSALLAIPAMAAQVYEGEVKGETLKVDVYGSIRTFVGGGANLSDKPSSLTGEGSGRGYDYEYGSLLLGVQGNSNFGVKTTYGKAKTNIQFGASEPNGIGTADATGVGLREFWGSYDFSFGTILIGKATNPTVDSGYTANWFNNDNGMQGFGGEFTGDRKIQIQYHIAGLKVAVIEDNLGVLGSAQTTTTSSVGATPRLAINYEMKLDSIDFKVGGNYKHYNNTALNTGANNTWQTDIDAWNIVVGVKPKFGSSYVSVLLNAGQNSFLYGAQRIGWNAGGYSNNLLGTTSTITPDATTIEGTSAANTISYLGKNAMIYGGVVTFGTKFTDELSFAVGAGYQLAAGVGTNTNEYSTNNEVSSYAVYANLPYQISKGLSIVPQVAYYHSEFNTKSATNVPKAKFDSVLAAIRFKFDF